MPLKLIAPAQGRTPYYRVRGTYLRVYLDRSTKTSDRRLAQRILARWRRDIEDGVLVSGTAKTFASAALSYMQFGGERRFLPKLLNHFGETPIERIDQAAVDRAAAALFPNVSAATRVRHVYTPVAAILNHASPERLIRFRRPRVAAGRTLWCEPEQMRVLLANMPRKIRRIAIFMLYSGCRIGEALALDWQNVNFAERMAYVPRTKSGEPRAVHLTEAMIAALAEIEPKRGQVFGYRRRSSMARQWRDAARKAGLVWVTPHVMRHTWATWMRRYAGADIRALISTGAWKDMRSAWRYIHVTPDDSARTADLLPQPNGAEPARAKRGPLK